MRPFYWIRRGHKVKTLIAMNTLSKNYFKIYYFMTSRDHNYLGQIPVKISKVYSIMICNDLVTMQARD